jgi:hypothetical protein
MRRISADDIAEMRRNGCERDAIADAELWLSHCREAEVVAAKVRAAFCDVTLGDGIGLRESDGIDDYAGADELARLRALDEKLDWTKISPDLLSRCNAAPSFLDERGMLFHTPAFVVAELTDAADVGFIDRLIYGSYTAITFHRLLTPEQRVALIACFRFYGGIDHYCYDSEDIGKAVFRICG